MVFEIAPADFPIDRVEARGLHADKDLAFAGHRLRGIRHDLKDLRPAILPNS